MAPESQMKNAISEVTNRQKMIAAAFIVVVLVIIWQVVGLLGNKSVKVTPAPSVGALKKDGQFNSSSPSQLASSEPVVRQAPVQTDNQFMKMQHDAEQQYVSKVNELESLKIQREIAEMNQAISAAKLATVTAEKGISDVLTKPSLPPVSAGEYASRLASPVRQGESVVGGQPGSAVPAEVTYTVISVSMQLHKWSAVIGYQGKLYNVSVGDVLPLDGAVVESINRGGVVLRKNGKSRKISLVSAI